MRSHRMSVSVYLAALAAFAISTSSQAMLLMTENTEIERTWTESELLTRFQAFAQTPLGLLGTFVFAQTSSYNGGHPGNIRINGANMKFKEADDDGYHATETADLVGILGDPRLLGLNAEVGSLQVDTDSLYRVEFSGEYTDPVIIAQVVSHNGGQPVSVTVTPDHVNGGALLALYEPWVLDGHHPAETVNYLVIEAGDYVLPDGRILIATNTPVDSPVSGRPEVDVPSISEGRIQAEGSTVLASAYGPIGYAGVRMEKFVDADGGLQLSVRHMRDAATEDTDMEFSGAIGIVAISDPLPGRITPPTPGALRVTEYMLRPSVAGGQWMEVLNTTDHPISLEGVSITTGLPFPLDGFTYDEPRVVPAHTYIVIATNGDRATNGNIKVDIAIPGFALHRLGTMELIYQGLVIDSMTPSGNGDAGRSWALDRQTLLTGSTEVWCQQEARFDGSTSDHASPRAANRACDPDQRVTFIAPTAANGSYDGRCVRITARPAVENIIETTPNVATVLAAYDNDDCFGDPVLKTGDADGAGFIRVDIDDAGLREAREDGGEPSTSDPWRWVQYRSYRVLASETVEWTMDDDDREVFRTNTVILENTTARVSVDAQGFLVLSLTHPAIGQPRDQIIAGPYNSYIAEDDRFYGRNNDGSQDSLFGGSTSGNGEFKLTLDGHGQFYHPVVTGGWQDLFPQGDDPTIWDLAKTGGLSPITIDYVDLDQDGEDEMVAIIASEDGTGTLIADPFYIALLAKQMGALTNSERGAFFAALSPTQQSEVGNAQALLQDTTYTAVGYKLTSLLDEIDNLDGLTLLDDDCGEGENGEQRFVVLNVCNELEKDAYMGGNFSVQVLNFTETWELGGANVKVETTVGQVGRTTNVGPGVASTDVGASAFSVGTSFETPGGTEIGVGVGAGVGFAADVQWGDQIGLTFDVKFVTISFYVGREDMETFINYFFTEDGFARDFSDYLFESCFLNPLFCEMGN